MVVQYRCLERKREGHSYVLGFKKELRNLRYEEISFPENSGSLEYFTEMSGVSLNSLKK